MKVLTLYHFHNKVAEHKMQSNQEIIIGRGQDCTISIDGHSISRKHLRIFFENNQWNIECISRFGQLKSNDGHIFSQKTINAANTNFEFWMADYKVCISNAATQKSTDDNKDVSNPEKTSLMILPDQDQKDDMPHDPENNLNADDNLGNFENSQLIPLEDNMDNNKSVSGTNSSSASLHVPDEKSNAPEDSQRTQLAQQGLHSAHLEARLKVLKKVGEEEQFVLKGTKWAIGRSKNCEIVLNHPKISRTHCEIIYIEDEYYIKDLKSANGTSVNGKKISNLQATLLQSNDHIQVEDLILCFELYNIDIEEKLSDLNLEKEKEKDVSYSPKPDITSDAMGNTPNNSSLQPINSPPPGVVRIPSNVKSRKPNKKKVIRFAIIALIVGIGYVSLFDNSEEIESKSQPSKSNLREIGHEFENLTPEQKSTVVNSYKVAKELQLQSKFRVALTEIQKIHALISSYKDSKDIEKILEASLETLRQNEEVNQRIEEEQRLRQEVANIINYCEEESRSYTDPYTSAKLSSTSNRKRP